MPGTTTTVPQTLARADSPAGEVALRRRFASTGPIYELIVNGVFAMDSAETRSEIRLAELALADGARRILVGGLGLGWTALTLARGGAERVDVVELATPLIEWARAGLVPSLTEVVAAPAVRLFAGDVAQVLAGRDGPAGPWDAVLLDVDNGPDFLIRPENGPLYAPEALRAATRSVAPGGRLYVWCQGESPELAATLAGLGDATTTIVPVRRDGHAIDYVIYRLAPAPAAAHDRRQ